MTSLKLSGTVDAANALCRREEAVIPSRNGSSFFPSHLLFMMGGLLLGYSIAGLVIPDDPNVMRRVLTIVIGLSVLIVGRQTALGEGSSAPDG